MLPVQVSSKHKIVAVPKIPAVANMFPEGATLELRGQELVAIPHGIAETFLLRKLGFEVPSPILTHYDWCGGKPFDVQKKTCAMLTMNNRAFVLNGMGCVDADTEYLSPTGWQRIADYSEGKVAQYDPQSGAIEFVEPIEYVKLPCAEMIRFKTARNVDQLLSPEHRVLLSDGRVMSAEAIEMAYGSRASRDFKFRTTYVVSGTTGIALTDDQIRLQVAVNADAYQPARRVYVRLKKPRKVARMRSLLAAAGVPYKSRLAGGYEIFSFVPPMRKGFDTQWWDCTQKQLEVVADEAVHWDGSVRKAGGRAFSSMCKQDADFVQYAFGASGRRASLTQHARFRRGRTEVEWVVHASAGCSDVGLYGVSSGVVRNNVWREPSTDGFKYCFMVPTTFLLLRRNGCVFATGNTGKTKAALWAWHYLWSNRQCGKLLVVAPLSTLTFTWAREVFNTLPGVQATVLHGSREKRLQKLNDPTTDVFVINHDGLRVIADDILKRDDIDCMVIDELAVYRNGGSERTKIARKVAHRMKWVWGMTGSPIPNEPTDAWAQASIVAPGNVPKYFGRFREELMYKITAFKWAAKPDAIDKAFAALQPAVRFTLDDVMELPECIERTVDVELGPKQAKVYKSLVDHCYAAVHAKEITAANAGAVMMKLLQVSTGWVYSADKGIVPLDNEKRIEALLDAISATERKVLVFVPFKHALAGISEALDKEKIEHAVVSGDTAASERATIFNLFQNTQKYRVLLAHPQCLAHGITLTAADTIIWFAPVTSLEIYDQANHRIRRVGQHHKQLVLHLQATPVERKIYALLQRKQKVQEKLLELFEDASRHSND